MHPNFDRTHETFIVLGGIGVLLTTAAVGGVTLFLDVKDLPWPPALLPLKAKLWRFGGWVKERVQHKTRRPGSASRVYPADKDEAARSLTAASMSGSRSVDTHVDDDETTAAVTLQVGWVPDPTGKTQRKRAMEQQRGKQSKVFSTDDLGYRDWTSGDVLQAEDVGDWRADKFACRKRIFFLEQSIESEFLRDPRSPRIVILEHQLSEALQVSLALLEGEEVSTKRSLSLAEESLAELSDERQTLAQDVRQQELQLEQVSQVSNNLERQLAAQKRLDESGTTMEERVASQREARRRLEVELTELSDRFQFVQLQLQDDRF